jgi:hypothetical protein
MSWFLCTVARSSARNWDLCKEAGLWGISTHGKKINFDRARGGDRLLIWIAGQGYVAHATVTGPMRVPNDPTETPWPEGRYRYGAVVPMDVNLELKEPLLLKFPNQRQELTDISLFQFRRGFVAIRDEAASAAVKAMKKKQAQQRKQQSLSGP